VAIALFAFVLGGGTVAHATTPDTIVPVTTPDTTPDTTPATVVTTPATVAPDNGGSDIDWFPIVLVAVLGIVLISILVALMSRRKPAPAPAAAARPASPAASPQSEIMSTAQWVHDQLSLEILAAAPAAGLQRWTAARQRCDQGESAIHRRSWRSVATARTEHVAARRGSRYIAATPQPRHSKCSAHTRVDRRRYSTSR